jgi:glycosyltransferase involved in cell wall biosynthesis
MKILQLALTLGAGGAERIAVGLSNRLAAREDDEVVLVSILDDSVPRNVHYLKDLSPRVRFVNLHCQSALQLKAIWRVLAVIRRERPDVVHCHTIAAVLLLPVLFLPKVRYVHTMHSVPQRIVAQSGFVKRKIMDYLFRRNKVKPVTISESCHQSYYETFGKRNDVCITNGSEPLTTTSRVGEVTKEVDSLKASPETIVFIHVARHHPAKNHERLFSTFLRLEREGVDFILIVLGEHYEPWADKLRESKRIFLLGAKSNVGDYMAQADYFVLSSDYEGLPMTMLEAMSMGVATVSTPAGGVVDVIEDGVTGYMSHTIDDEAFYQKVKQAISERDRLSPKVVKGNYEKSFSMEAFARKYYEVYKGGSKSLAFVRYALAPDRFEAPDMSEKDWLRLYRFAYKQRVLGIIFEGVSRYQANGVIPPRIVVMEWMSKTTAIKLRNKMANNASAKIIELTEHDGFKCCLLKGQGNNMLYPNPYSRTPGDIDLWVMKADDKKPSVREIIRYVKKHNPKGRTLYHHIDYGVFEKVDVEVHYRPSFFNNPIYNHRLQHWFREQAQTQFANRVELPGNAGTIAVPTPEFNAIYQLAHIYSHMLNRGIGLRQLVDYYYVLQSLKDVQGMEGVLRHLGLRKIGGAVMWALGFMLGMEEKYMITAPNERLGRLLAKEIVKGGNFGQYGKDTRRLMNSRKKSAWRFWMDKNLQRLKFDVRMVWYFPSECLCEPLFRGYHFLWRCAMSMKN